MKASIIISLLLLTACVGFLALLKKETLSAERTLTSLKANAGSLGIPTDPNLPFEADDVRADFQKSKDLSELIQIGEELASLFIENKTQSNSEPESVTDLEIQLARKIFELPRLSSKQLKLLSRIIIRDETIHIVDRLDLVGFCLKAQSLKDPRSAADDAIKLFQSVELNPLLAQDLIKLTIGDYIKATPREAAKWLGENEGSLPLLIRDLRNDLIAALAKIDPAAAFSMAVIPDSDFRQAALDVIGFGLVPENAPAFFKALRDSDFSENEKKIVGRQIASGPFAGDFEKASKALASGSISGEDRVFFYHSVFENHFMVKQTEIIDWLRYFMALKNIEGFDPIESITTTLPYIIVRNYQAVGQWIDEQPPSESKRMWQKTYYGVVSRHDMKAAMRYGPN